MKLDFIALGRLVESKANMRGGRKEADVADLLPSVRQRGILVPILVRPVADTDSVEVIAGRRRHRCARIVADESGVAEPVPCAIMDPGDDAAALGASLLENIARLDPDEVTRWEQFVRLVKAGRRPQEIGATFGLPDAMVRRILALGNLLPRIRELYRRDAIDTTTVRHLTLASKQRQRDWLALLDDPEARAPVGHALKAWLFGGASIATSVALFDLAAYPGEIVIDLFGDGGYFADADSFWAAQYAAIEVRRIACLDAGWAEVVVLPPADPFHGWEYEKTSKHKGGRVYIDVHANGEVRVHEGYVSRREAEKAARAADPRAARPARPEVGSAMQSYCDLHRHVAVRAAMLSHPAVALRLMVAHAIAGSPLWSVRIEPQAARVEAVRESLATAPGEALFEARRREVLALIGLDPESPTLRQGHGDEDLLPALFLCLLDRSDDDVLRVIAIVMGETLAAGSPAVDAVGLTLGIDMADWWEADAAFFALIRDREVLAAMLHEVGGRSVGEAYAKEKMTTIRGVIADHLDGTQGRPRVERWVPRWMRFPPSGYTARGGVGTVAAHAKVADARMAAQANRPPDTESLVPVAGPVPDALVA